MSLQKAKTPAKDFFKILALCFIAYLIIFATRLASAQTPPTNNTPHPQTGLYCVGKTGACEDESGWGIKVTRKANTGFVEIYSYAEDRTPVWYVIGDCQFVGNNCTGPIYRGVGGTPLTTVWNRANLGLVKVGDGVLVFSDNNNAKFTSTIDGKTSVKVVARNLFGNNTPAVNYALTDIWWNSNESGWGVSMTQQRSVVFATFYTYLPNGLPIWYVVSDCRLAAPTSTQPGLQPVSCSGDIYEVTGGVPITTPWTGAQLAIKPAGKVVMTFASSNPLGTPATQTSPAVAASYDKGGFTLNLATPASSGTAIRDTTRYPYGVEQAAGVCGLTNAVSYQQKMTNIGGATSACATVMRVGQYVDVWKPLNPYLFLDNILGADGRWAANLTSGNVVIMATNEMAPDQFGVIRNLSRAIYALPTDAGLPRSFCITAIYGDTGRGFGQDQAGATCFLSPFEYVQATDMTYAVQGLIFKEGGRCGIITIAAGFVPTSCPR